ncbi:acylaminoacyl-peptidase, partial [human gut metagenome]
MTGPYQTIYQSAVKKEPVSFSLDTKLMTGEFSIKDSLWYNFSLKKNTCDLVFDRKEVILPAGMELARATLSHSQKFLTMELRPYQEKVNKDKKEEEVKPDKSFELELWTWDEYEVPTLQTRGRYFRPQYSKYIYDIASGKLMEV